MTKEECMELIRKRISKCEKEKMEDFIRTNHSGFVSNTSWYEGIKRGLQDALEIIGMIDKPNKL
jgi:hypothetical protein